MQADAERQRQKSESTLSDLQVALDSIQSQVLSVVNDSDGGTKVVKAGSLPVVEAVGKSAPPPVYQEDSTAGDKSTTMGSIDNAAGNGGSNVDKANADKATASVGGRNSDNGS